VNVNAGETKTKSKKTPLAGEASKRNTNAARGTGVEVARTFGKKGKRIELAQQNRKGEQSKDALQC